MRVEPTVAARIVLLCCILHNVAIKIRAVSDDFGIDDVDVEEYEEDEDNHPGNENGDAEITSNVNQNLINFFT